MLVIGITDLERLGLKIVPRFATLVLGQDSVAAKSNEITAIAFLLEWLKPTGAFFTIDAIGTQIGEEIT